MHISAVARYVPPALMVKISKLFQNVICSIINITTMFLLQCTGVGNTAFRHLMEFTYTATLAVNGEEEVSDVWRAAEYLQMQEAIKALNNRLYPPTVLLKHFLLSHFIL